MNSLPSVDRLPGDRTTAGPRLGICSVTLRRDDPATVIRRTTEAGLQSIEWGSDVHVPAGRVDLAREVGLATREAGLEVCSYGSYIRFPWAQGDAERIEDVLDTAVALGTSRVRVWAGPHGSGDVEPSERAASTRELARMADLAAQRDIELAVEFHLGTLADTAESTLQLIADLDDRVSTYWQPRVGAADSDALEDLHALGRHVSAIHVFSWGPRFERYRLDYRADLWQQAVSAAMTLPSVTDLLIEFLPDDDPSLLSAEAATVRRWFDSATMPGRIAS